MLATKRTLVLSASAGTVRSVLDVVRGSAPALTGDSQTTATISRLGTMAAAMILPGAGACPPDLRAALHAKGSRVRRMASRPRSRGLHPYMDLGVGYRDEGGRPVGLVVLHYLNVKKQRRTWRRAARWRRTASAA